MRQTLDAVTKMVQSGTMSAKDAIKHAEALNSIKVSVMLSATERLAVQ